MNEKEKREVLARKPALEWSVQLPAVTDYKSKTFSAEAPGSLKPGFYFILASADPAFGEKGNVISMADIWVSDLTLLTRGAAGGLEGFVLNANSGEPVVGAEISTWHLDGQGTRISEPVQTTDANGRFFEQLPNNRGYLVRARYQGQAVATENEVPVYEFQT